MILLKLISWPYVRKHLLRSALTVAGIVLGIAVFVAMHTANQAVLGAFNQMVDRIAGRTQLQVSAGPAGFEEEVLERVQSLAEVRVAVPVIEATVDSGLPGQGNLLILAVDMTGDSSLRDYDLEGGDEEAVPDPLVFLAQLDSLIVTREFAARNGLKTGSTLTMRSMEGDKRFTIRGLMKPGGLASAFGSSLAIMDIYSAQKVFGRGRRFDRIDLAAAEGVSVEQCRAAIQKLLGPGFEVEPPSSRGQQFESLLKVYSAAVNLSSAFSLIIGMFIIYNSFSIAVTQRRSEIGILRALGATQGQVRGLFLGESALAGVGGSLLGIALGGLLAQSMAGYVSDMVGGIYGVAQRPDQVHVQFPLAMTALAIGVATSMIAALIPARNAARVDPVKALQKGRYQVLASGESRARTMAAFATAVLAAACLLAAGGGSKPLFYAGYLLMIFTALLLTPFAALWITRALRPLLKWLRPVEGALAADSVIQAPRRTSATVAALMLSLSVTIGLSGVARASYESILEWAESTFNPDLFVTTSENISNRNFVFPGSMRDALAAVEGIADVHSVRSYNLKVGGAPVMMVAIDLAGITRRTSSKRTIAGDYDEMHRRAGAGKGVIISENLAILQQIPMGREIEIPTPSGPLRLPVVGIVRDYSGQQGTLFLELGVYRRYWKDDTVDIFRVYLKPGMEPAEAKRRILERFQGERRLFVMFNHELKAYILRLTDQWFGMTYIQIAIAVLVAVLGIVNTLTVSIADRRRELGILRAVGGLRMQIRRTIWLEAALIGMVGLILGLAMGSIDLFYQLEMLRRDFSGMPLDYRFPWTVAASLIPVILGAALLASIGPAESAVRGSLVEALEYE